MIRRSFLLEPRSPFRLDLTVWALRRDPGNAVDRWDGRVYQRVFVVNGEPIAITVSETGVPGDSRLRIVMTGQRFPRGTRSVVTDALGRLLGLRTDLTAFYQFAAGDAKLGPLAERFRGLKPPRFPSIFETLVNAVACQQITITLGVRLLNRLAESYGPSGDTGPGSIHALPSPDALACVDEDGLRTVGFSPLKAQALLTLAAAVAEGALDLGAVKAMDDDAAVAYLRQLYGVGRWTAQYVLLRGLGRLHVFPGDDVGARNNLRRWLDLPEPLDYKGVRRVLVPWAPYSGLVYLHLLLDHLATKADLPGVLDPPSPEGWA